MMELGLSPTSTNCVVNGGRGATAGALVLSWTPLHLHADHPNGVVSAVADFHSVSMRRISRFGRLRARGM